MKKLLVIIFIALFAQSYASTSVTLGIKINKKCQNAYERGHLSYLESLENKNSPDILSTALNKIENQCQSEFSIGALDAKTSLSQQVAIEYLFEIIHGQLSTYDRKLIYQLRLKQLELPPQTLQSLEANTHSLSAAKKYFNELQNKASQTNEPIPFGRFIFVKNKRVFTAYDFFVYSKKVGLGKGSYQREIEKLYGKIQKNIENYQAWRPSILSGPEGLLSQQSIRYEVANNYIKVLDTHLVMAKKLSLNIKPLLELKTSLLEFETSRIEQDLDILKKLKYGIISSLLIPGAMTIFNTAIAGSWASATAGSSFKILNAAHIAKKLNYSAKMVFSTIGLSGALGALRALDEIKNDKNVAFSFSRVAEQSITSMVSSFPMAFFLPFQVGMTIHLARFIKISAFNMIYHARVSQQTLKGWGKRAFYKVPLLPVTIPAKLTKAWAFAWWNRLGILTRHYLVDGGAYLIFEIGTREFLRLDRSKSYFNPTRYINQHGENILGLDPFFDRDENGKRKYFAFNDYDEKAKYSAVTYFISAAIAKPIIFLNTFHRRFWTINALMLGSSMIAGPTVNYINAKVKGEEFDPHINWNRVDFDIKYTSTFEMILEEIDRKVKFSSFVLNSGPYQNTILLVYKLGLRAVEMPIKNFLLDNFLEKNVPPAQIIREVFLEGVKIDLSRISDEQLTDAFRTFLEDPEAKKWVKEGTLD